jgi:hypothetical protein
MRLFLPAIGPPAAVWLKSTVGTILQIFSPQLLQSPHTFGTISSRNVHSAAGGAITDTALTVAEPAHAADRMTAGLAAPTDSEAIKAVMTGIKRTIGVAR